MLTQVCLIRTKLQNITYTQFSNIARVVSGPPLVEVGVLVINWRNAIARKSKVFLKGIIDSIGWAVLSLRTLQYGFYSYDFWNKTTL